MPSRIIEIPPAAAGGPYHIDTKGAGDIIGGVTCYNYRCDEDGGDVYRAMEIAEESEFVVDVVDLRLLPEHVRKRVLESGRIVAER